MNILWLTWKDLDNPLAGGAEVVNEELASRLAADGHSVTLLTSGFPGSAHRAKRHGFAIIRTGSRFTNYLTTARYVIKHRAALKPDLVIDECNTMPYFAGWYVRARTVLFFHMLCRQIWFYEFPGPLAVIGYLAEPIYLRLLRPRRPVITMSESTKADLIRHGFAAEAISIVSEATRVRPVGRLEQAGKFKEPTMLSHGSVRPMKRTLDQIKAFERTKASIPGLKLKVSGDTSGPYGAKVLHYIEASRFRADIEVLGRTTDAQRLELMRRCHVITVTSVKEGWGLIVTEAAGQGTPAIVYNVDGLRDAVRDGQTGLITATNTPAALAQSIAELLADDGRYQAYREAGWQWAQQLTFDQSYQDFRRALGL